jgi:hypothetical protein
MAILLGGLSVENSDEVQGWFHFVVIGNFIVRYLKLVGATGQIEYRSVAWQRQKGPRVLHRGSVNLVRVVCG